MLGLFKFSLLAEVLTGFWVEVVVVAMPTRFFGTGTGYLSVVKLILGEALFLGILAIFLGSTALLVSAGSFLVWGIFLVCGRLVADLDLIAALAA